MTSYERYITGPTDDGGYSLWTLGIEPGSDHAVVRCSGTVVGTLPITGEDSEDHLGRMLGQFVHLLEQVTA